MLNTHILGPLPVEIERDHGRHGRGGALPWGNLYASAVRTAWVSIIPHQVCSAVGVHAGGADDEVRCRGAVAAPELVDHSHFFLGGRICVVVVVVVFFFLQRW